MAASLVALALVTLTPLYTGAQKNEKPQPELQPVTPKPAAVKAEAPKPAATESIKDETPVGPTDAEVASYLEGYGWMVGQQAGFEMGFSKEEKAAIMKGLERAAAGEKAPENMKEIFPKMQEYLSTKEKSYRAATMAKMAEEAKVHVAEGEKFLADIAKQADVKKTESGLYYKIETPGTGASPAAEDIVTIHYTGKLIDGTVFDSSIERGTPVDLPLYGVIPGFSEGLRLLKEGGKATLYIPSSLGYGEQAAGPIPPGSTLVFHVELIKVQAAPAPEADDADATAPESAVTPKADNAMTKKAMTK